MSNHTYNLVEIVGTSPDGIDAAISNGLERAARTMRHLDWMEVTEIRGHMADGRLADVQVTMKVGFRLEDSDARSETGAAETSATSEPPAGSV